MGMFSDFIEVFFLFIEGLLAFFSPCILPMVPVYIVYLAGKRNYADLGKESDNESGNKTLILNTLGFILGFTIIFVAMGATASGIGHMLSSHRLLIQRISGVIIIIFGLHYMGVIKIGFLNKDKRFSANTGNLSVLSAILFGMAFSFGWTPCIGPLLGTALTLAANKDTVWHGMLLLFVFSAGLGVPFFLSALILDKLKSAFDFIKKHFRIITFISGALLIITGLALSLDVFGYWAALFSFL